MIYLDNIWSLIIVNSGAISIMLGNMLIILCFMRPRWKWWLYPLLLIISVFALPMIFLFSKILLGTTIDRSVLLILIGYGNLILVPITFREHFANIISLIYVLCILNRLFTFCGYILYIPLNALSGGKLDARLSVTLFITTMYIIISLICWFFLREKGRKLIQSLHHNNWVVLAIITVTAKLIIDFCSDYIISVNPYSERKIILAMIALCVFAIAVIVLYLYSTLTAIKHSELKVASEHLIFEKEAQKRYYETQLNNQEELRRMKHDMNGHLNTVFQLLHDNKKEEALHYLISLGDYTEHNQKELYSQDPYLNAVVANYAAIFADHDIPFELDIQIGYMEIHYVEMCLALNNALQNALEASQNLPSNQRYVKLQIRTKQCRLLFRTTNRFNNNLNFVNGFPRSTKPDSGHGYGLISIRDAAESVGGFINFKIEDTMFVLDVAM